MEKVTGGPPESPTRRAARIARVGARYGFGFVFGGRLSWRRGRAATARIGPRLRLSLEELGPTFAEFGRFLSARADLIPPNVASELARASAPAKPVSFPEARAIVEKELGNTVERLFVRFEEAPIRTGPFTQAHRAVLPGGRPALVVFGRPGIRRDLLAMRPVADLTRRRIGGRLPLDPALSVSEFTAHVNHRRDMFFAARISRRLGEMDAFALRVPELYRNLSSGRCATFEAPAASRNLDELQGRLVANSLVRLALTEGIFLADPSPERFAVDGRTGEVWLSDPTEAFALDPERLRGLAEILAAVRRGVVDGVVRALPLAGSAVPRDDADLRRELRETLGSLGGPLWEEHSLAVIRARSLEALRRGGSKLHDEVAQAARAGRRLKGGRGQGPLRPPGLGRPDGTRAHPRQPPGLRPPDSRPHHRLLHARHLRRRTPDPRRQRLRPRRLRLRRGVGVASPRRDNSVRSAVGSSPWPSCSLPARRSAPLDH